MENTATRYGNVTEVLSGHTSPDTAYVVADYPYGFTLRCSIRYWIETKHGHGQRVVSQTTNPKKSGTVWNKPKTGTYSLVKVLFKDDNGYVQNTGISGYSDDPEIDAFVATFAAGLSDRDVKLIEAFKAARAKFRARLAAQTQEVVQ